MSHEDARGDLTKVTAVYRIPGMESVIIRKDVEFRAADGGVLAMDLYYPPDWRAGDRTPAVVLVAGYPDTGTKLPVGFRELGMTTSWAKLIAASGLVAITYTNREPDGDCCALLEYLHRNAAALGIDGARMGVSASSANVPVALSALMRAGCQLKCAVFNCGFLMDLEGSTVVAQASKEYGFVNACAGKSVDDLPPGLPLLLVRAGQDQFAHINDAIDRFVAHALRRNLPVTLVNFASAPHGFDLFLDNESSREVIRQMLAFMRFHLSM